MKEPGNDVDSTLLTGWAQLEQVACDVTSVGQIEARQVERTRAEQSVPHATNQEPAVALDSNFQRPVAELVKPNRILEGLVESSTQNATEDLGATPGTLGAV